MVVSLYQPLFLLQFGHGLGAVENATGECRQHVGYPLQFGHGLGAVENKTGVAIVLQRRRASIRPRTRGRGEQEVRRAELAG